MRSKLIILIISVISCTESDSPLPVQPPPEEKEHVYYHGEQIPGTETFLPFGNGIWGVRGEPKVSPDGRFFVYRKTLATNDTTYSHGLYLFDINLGESKPLIIERSARNPDWSSDRKLIVLNIGNQIYKMNLENENLIQLTNIGLNYFPAWSPDGRYIAYFKTLGDTEGDKGLWIMNNDGSNKKWKGYGSEPSWNHTGNKIITSWRMSPSGTEFREFNLKLDTTTVLYSFSNQPMDWPQYSPNDELVLFKGERAFWLLNVDSGNLKKILEGKMEKLWLGNPSWYPDGKHIIYDRYDITRYEETIYEPITEGYHSFYKMNIDSALHYAE